MKKTLTSVLCVISVLFLRAQSYHGLHGNLFSSGLTVYDNPASTVRLPHIWDITPIATQQKVSTNIIAIHDYSLLSSPEKSQYEVKAGYYSREAHYQSDFRLMNTRVALGKNKAIAFGANIRNYLHLRSTPYYFIDTIRDVQHFAEMNQMTTSSLGAKMIASSWGEIYGTYAQTIYCDEITHFSGGATLKIQRGLAGAYLKASNGNFRLSDVSFIPHFELYDGMAQVGYSSNFDKLYSDRSFNENAKAFLINT
ncbi:MAG TPA: hypothetical protein VIK74_08620, partial [Parasegetibacter sp.]